MNLTAVRYVSTTSRTSSPAVWSAGWSATATTA